MAGENGGQATATSGPPDLADLLAKARASAGGGVSNVYMGNSGKYVGSRFVSSDKVQTADQAELNFYTWSMDETRAWGQRLYKAGILKDPTDYDSMFSVWKAAVAKSAAFYAVGKKVTPWDVIGIQENLSGVGGPNGPRVGKPKTVRRVDKNIQNLSPADADAYTKQVFQDMVGRDPTDGELAKYRSMLIGLSAKNPQVTTTTSNYDAEGVLTGSVSNTTGGFTSGMAQSAVQGGVDSTAEYGTYLAAVKYYNALQGALGAAI